MGILDRALERAGYVRSDSGGGYAPPGVPEGAHDVPRPEENTRRATERRRADDWSGVLGSYGARHMGLSGMEDGTLADEFTDASHLYGRWGLASLIVDRMAEDAVAAGFRIPEDESNDILNELDRLDGTQIFIDALRWARLYGASAVMPLVEDGLPLDAPLDLTRIQSVIQLMVYAGPQITMGTGRYTDPTLPSYGWATHYEIRPTWGEAFLVHESRLFPVGNDPMALGPGQVLRLPWQGRPVLNGCYKSLMRYRRSLRLAELILERKQQPVHKMSDLGGMLQAGLDDVVAKRLEAADLARGILTTVAVDALDDFKVIDTSVTGVDQIIRENKISVAADSGFPMLVLFQEQPAGMNNTGVGEFEGYHARVNQTRERSIRPLVERIAPLIWAQRSVPNKEPNHWRVVFEPLWSPSAEENARTAKGIAEAKKAQIEAIGEAVKQRLIAPNEAREVAIDTVFKGEILPGEADGIQPDNSAETARQTGANAIKAILDMGLVTPNEARDLARRLFVELKPGPAPEPPDLDDPSDEGGGNGGGGSGGASPGGGAILPNTPKTSDPDLARELSETLNG